MTPQLARQRRADSPAQRDDRRRIDAAAHRHLTFTQTSDPDRAYAEIRSFTLTCTATDS
jgi:hypothetical protein